MMIVMELPTFVTGNPHKAAQLSRHLGVVLDHQALDLTEIQSLDLHAVATDKAERAYRLLQRPVLVEDTSLSIPALGGLPGPLIKWFLEALGNEGIVDLLRNKTDRSATASVAFALHDGQSTEIFTGAVSGSIGESPQGERGFGWDPIFIPTGATKTWGQMTDVEQSNTSMRKIALDKLAKHLLSE